MKKIFLVLTVLLAFGCSDDEKKQVEDIPFEPITISPTLVGKGQLNGGEGIVEQDTIIDTDIVWTSLKNQIDAQYIAIGMGNYYTENNFEETEIDFSEFTVIAVIDHPYPNGGHTIDITNIIEYEDEISVTIENLQTGKTSHVATQPYHIVKIPKTTKPVVFEHL